MIVCHCNIITQDEIAETIEELLEDDEYRLITPGLVYRQLGKRGKCCGCFPSVVQIIVAKLEQFQSSNLHPALLRKIERGLMTPVSQATVAALHQKQD